MSVSDVSIVNDAISLIGAERIISLDADTKTARLFKEAFAKTRNALLEAHPWRFAMKRAALALSSETPPYEYSYYYVLPTDCLRVIELSSPTVDWEREGKLLATKGQIEGCRYIREITQPGLFSANFSKALAAKLAYENCYSIVQSLELKEKLKEHYLVSLAEARSYSAQEAAPKQPYANQWLNSRY